MAVGGDYSYYSDNGIDWTQGQHPNFYSSLGLYPINIFWLNSQFIIVGGAYQQTEPKSSFLYSLDGTSWSVIPIYLNSVNEIEIPQMNGVAGNPKVGPVIVPSAIHLNNNINSNTLTFSSESYYQSGVNNISIDVNTK